MGNLQWRDLQYRELRRELQNKGYQFRANSDTEVIIHGYKEWGKDVFNHLNGMFGLAIWDALNAAPGRGAGRDGDQAGVLPDR